VKALVKDIWERLLLYLPVAFMALLALGTYWLVRSTPDVAASQPPRPVSHDPDYFMEGFSVRTFDASGRIRTEVTGEKARHFPDTLWLEIDEIRIRSFDEHGRLTTARAKRGLTNEDSSEAQLLGNAVVVRESDPGKRADASPRTEYRGEFLHAFIKTEKIKSHKPVELIRGQDSFTADSLDFDNVDQVLQLRGRVKGVLTPGKP
jgi:lipopolysaccharide export system protein LptC